jgi:hypothetical protein
VSVPAPAPFFSCPALPEVTAEDLVRAGPDAVAGVPFGDLLPVMVPGIGLALVRDAEWERYRNEMHAEAREVRL